DVFDDGWAVGTNFTTGGVGLFPLAAAFDTTEATESMGGFGGGTGGPAAGERRHLLQLQLDEMRRAVERLEAELSGGGGGGAA
ncbi:hypothetical protein HK405_002070, partial [Cladochytrium tenue]